MKKTIQTAFHLLIASFLVSETAFAKLNLECKTQLARTLEEHTEVLPSGQDYDKLEISEEGTAKASYTFSLRGGTDVVYRLDLFARIKPSNWSRGTLAFVLESKLWDVKNNKLVGIKTENSDNVRTRYLLSQLLEEDKAIIAADTQSFDLRTQLMASEDSEVASLANEGRWFESTKLALGKALVNPYTAHFASINCILEN
jgi:hypothetical protein